jgi:oligopeptide/dipeptide ABC transporter ATP-binding protein
VPADFAGAGDPIVVLRDVVKEFPGRSGVGRRRQSITALDHVSVNVLRGETLGLVGESGCGKSTLARTMLRLTELTSGSVEFDGRDISRASIRALRPLRRDMQLILQDSFAALNPRHTVGVSIGEALRAHHLGDRMQRGREVERLIELVGLSAHHYNSHPRDLSGGQRQRVCIARALAIRPKLLVCDEPVSALDVSIQAQIVNLLLDLQEEFNLTYVFISHDLVVVRQLADRVAVMYLGRVVELADAIALFTAPRHPYTAALLSATPVADPEPAKRRARVVLQGDPPSPSDPPTGCAFHPRCPRAQSRCANERPALVARDGAGLVACHFPLAEGGQLVGAQSGPATDQPSPPNGFAPEPERRPEKTTGS